MSQGGLPDREFYKHVVFAPGLDTGYAATTYPGITEAVEFAKNASLAEEWVGKTSRAIEVAAGILAGLCIENKCDARSINHKDVQRIIKSCPGELSSEKPDGLGIRHHIVKTQTEKTHQRNAILYLKLTLIVREVVPGIKNHDILDNLHHYHDQLTSLLTERFGITGKTFSQSHFT